MSDQRLINLSEEEIDSVLTLIQESIPDKLITFAKIRGEAIENYSGAILKDKDIKVNFILGYFNKSSFVDLLVISNNNVTQIIIGLKNKTRHDMALDIRDKLKTLCK